MSSTAARSLVEGLTQLGVRVLVLHDFDKAGFSIISTLTRDTTRYRFQVRPNVVDLGLRLTDVQAEGLAAESCSYGDDRNPAANLRLNGATEAEMRFLLAKGGQRVELNAFTAEHAAKQAAVLWQSSHHRRIGLSGVRARRYVLRSTRAPWARHVASPSSAASMTSWSRPATKQRALTRLNDDAADDAERGDAVKTTWRQISQSANVRLSRQLLSSERVQVAGLEADRSLLRARLWRNEWFEDGLTLERGHVDEKAVLPHSRRLQPAL